MLWNKNVLKSLSALELWLIFSRNRMHESLWRWHNDFIRDESPIAADAFSDNLNIFNYRFEIIIILAITSDNGIIAASGWAWLRLITIKMWNWIVNKALKARVRNITLAFVYCIMMSKIIHNQTYFYLVKQWKQ